MKLSRKILIKFLEHRWFPISLVLIWIGAQLSITFLMRWLNP